MKIIKPQPDKEESIEVVGLDDLSINYRKGGLYINGYLGGEGKTINESSIDIQLDFYEIEVLRILFDKGIL